MDIGDSFLKLNKFTKNHESVCKNLQEISTKYIRKLFEWYVLQTRRS